MPIDSAFDSHLPIYSQFQYEGILASKRNEQLISEAKHMIKISTNPILAKLSWRRL